MDEIDDRAMRGLYERNAPEVDSAETWEAIRDGIGARPGNARPGSGLRLVAICASVVLVLGALSVGVFELVDHLRQSQPLLVLGGGDEPGGEPNLTAFLEVDITTEETSALCDELAVMPEILRMTYISKEEALARVKEWFADQPEVLEGLSGNPLPASLEIWLADGVDVSAFAARISALPGVDQVPIPEGSGLLTKGPIWEAIEAGSSTSTEKTSGD